MEPAGSNSEPIYARTRLGAVVATVLAFALTALTAPTPATALGFDCISDNLAGDCAIGEAQLSVDVSDPGGSQVLFTFTNSGPDASSITDVYFDDGALLGIAAIINDPPDVVFSVPATPSNLPSANSASPPFVTTAGFSADSDPPPQPNGVNPGESLGIVFDLIGGLTFADVLADLADGSLRIGIHVQGFATGGSESLVNDGPAFCGDGIPNQPEETCEPPGAPQPPNDQVCRIDCTYCGDGVTDPSEECDDGNNVDDDGCTNDCGTPPPNCGDTTLDPDETCDPPGSDPPPPGGNLCRTDCTYCGDGVQNGAEECDDGNDVDNDGCRNSCLLPVCGDDIISQDETCEPPGAPQPPNGNDCRADCTYCGDGVIDPGEDCDDGNSVDDDFCPNSCSTDQDHFKCYHTEPISPVTPSSPWIKSFSAGTRSRLDRISAVDRSSVESLGFRVAWHSILSSSSVTMSPSARRCNVGGR